MRKIFRFFAIAATVAAAASCAKELAPAEGAESNVELIPYTIEASLPETKATLNNQQVVWQEGDKIAVFDGTAKQEFILTAGAGTKTAYFRGEVTATATKVSATYPYSAAGDALGKYTVPAVQNIAAGATVDPAALVMEAAAVNKGKALSFKNACGVARMTVPAGTTSAIFSSANSNTAITISAAPAAAATIDVVLPAQEYTDILVAVTTGEGSFVKASANTLTIKRSTILDLGDVKGEPASLITTGAELKTFLDAAAADTANTSRGYIVADLDLQGIELPDSAIINAGGVLDGRNHSLKNWTPAPVNAKRSGALVQLNKGTVKNIVLDKSCSFKTAGAGNTSFIVLENCGLVSNCVNNADITVSAITGTSNISAIVAKQDNETTAKTIGCVNNGNFVSPDGLAHAGQPLWGGIVGRLDAGSVENCSNTGDINVKFASKSSATYLGGVVGFACDRIYDGSSQTAQTQIINCSNSGAVAFVGGTLAGSARAEVGGVLGSSQSIKPASGPRSQVKVKGCRNSGAVKLDATATGSGLYNNVGGIAGYLEGDIEDCVVEASASVYVNNASTAKNFSAYSAGGIVGRLYYSAKNCVNEGCEVQIAGCCAAASDATPAFVCGQSAPAMGGLFGIAGGKKGDGQTVENCINRSSKIVYTPRMGATNGTSSFCGGVVGTGYAALKNCKNYGSFTVDDFQHKAARIGGVIGYAYADVEDCDNYGNLTVKGFLEGATVCSTNSSNQYYLAGIASYSAAESTIKNCSNRGKLTFVENKNNSTFSYVGGIVGRSDGLVEACSNSGECVSTSASNVRVAGVSAYGNGGVKDSKNSGTITVKNATAVSASYRTAVAGIAGHTGADITNCQSFGDIVCENCADSIGVGMLAGTVGSTAGSWDGNTVNCAISASNVKYCGYLLGGHLTIDSTKEAETITTKVGYTTPNKLFASATINGVNATAADCTDKTKLAGYLQTGCEAFFDVAANGVAFQDYGPNFVNFKDAANCFVVKPGAIAMFPTFKGEGGAKADIDAVELGWQDEKGLYAGTVQIADGSAIVKFADGKEGNALLLGKKAGVVVWSWHFWVASEGFNEVTIGDFTFLDRNIGATSLSEKTDKSFGVIYQYGRKDPYPCMKYGKYSESVLYGLKDIYDESGNTVKINVMDTEGTNNIENSIKNPTTFYRCYYEFGCKHNNNWVTTDIAAFGKDNFKALWENGGKKSSYDPCPAGYKVASVAAWNAVKTQTVTEIWDNEFETFDSGELATSPKYIPGVKKKVKFRGCDYGGLRLTVNGQVNANPAQGKNEFAYTCCIGKSQPTAIVWCADIDSAFDGTVSKYINFRGSAARVYVSGYSVDEDMSRIKVENLSTGSWFGTHYAFPVRCIKVK